MKNRITIETFNHLIIIDELKSSFLFYNDHNGNSVNVSFKIIDKLIDRRFKRDPVVILKTLAKFFTYENIFNETELVKIFVTVDLENKFYEMKRQFNNFISINNYSDFCLLNESIQYAKTGDQTPTSQHAK